MSDVTIYGDPRSSYVWTVRLVCEEKGISHELQAVTFGSEAHIALHPFGRIPILRHEDLVLFETSAIARYIDEEFGGPALKPVETRGRALMEQWISAINDYVYDPLIRRFVLQHVFPVGPDGKPDKAVVESALAEGAARLSVFEEALAGHRFLAGGGLSLADLFLAPILYYAGVTPGGARLLKPFPHLRKWLKAITARPGFEATRPPRDAR